MEDISKKIKKHRKILGITQKQLAKMIGIDARTLQRYESGVCKPEHDKIPKLAKALNVNEEYLLYDDYEAKLESVLEEIKFRNSELCSIDEKISEYEKEHTKEELECDGKYIEMLVLKEKIKCTIRWLSYEQACFKGQRII